MKEKLDFWVIFGLLIAVCSLSLGSVAFMFNFNSRLDSMSVRMDNMATKADIARVEASFKTDIARMDNMATKSDISEVKDELRDIRNILVDHIKDGHAHIKTPARSRGPASINK